MRTIPGAPPKKKKKKKKKKEEEEGAVDFQDLLWLNSYIFHFAG